MRIHQRTKGNSVKYATHYKCYTVGNRDMRPAETTAVIYAVDDDFSPPSSRTFDNILTGYYRGTFDTIDDAMKPALADVCCTSILDGTKRVSEWEPLPELWKGEYKREVNHD